MKCRFETNKILTAVKETNHTVTTSNGKKIHKKLASNPLIFQPSKKPEDDQKPTRRCKRCGRSSNDEFCDTQKRTMADNNKAVDNPCSSKTIPTMPSQEPTELPDITIISDSQSTMTEERPNTAESDQEVTVTAELKYKDGQLREPPSDNQTAEITPPVGCSTERAKKRTVLDDNTLPTASPHKVPTIADKVIVELSIERGRE